MACRPTRRRTTASSGSTSTPPAATSPSTANHLLSRNRATGAQAIVRNLIVPEQNSSGKDVYTEMTGPCFTPDGLYLFGNVQEPGRVFSISGPWRRYLG